MTRCDFCLVEIELGSSDSPWYDANDPDDNAGAWCPQSADHKHYPQEKTERTSPSEALQLINAQFPEELRGEDIDEAFDVLYDLCERDLNERESL